METNKIKEDTVFMCCDRNINYRDIISSNYYFETYSKIEELKKDFYVNHGFIHIASVIENAKYLADLFGLDNKQKEQLLIAGALHDIGYLMGREDHAKNGGRLAFEYLKDKLPKEDVDVVCNAISSHGGKEESDYLCPVSLCLILADKFDFSKQRYKDDGKEHKSLPLFLSIEKVLLVKEDENNFKLNVCTTNKKLFDNLEENYFFIKLFEVLKRVQKVNGKKIGIQIVECESDFVK